MQNNKNCNRKHWNMAAVLFITGMLACAQPMTVLAEDGTAVTAEPAPAPVAEPTPAVPVETPAADPVPVVPAGQPAGEPTPVPSDTPIPDPSDTPVPVPSETPSPEPSGTPEPEVSGISETDPGETPEVTPGTAAEEEDQLSGTEAEAAEETAGEDSVSSSSEEDESETDKEDEEDGEEKEETEEEKAEREKKEKEEAEKAGFFEFRMLVEGEGKVRIKFLGEDGNPVEILYPQVTPSIVRIKKGTEVLLFHEEEKNSAFDEWKIKKGTIQLINDRFTMPEGEVEIQAVFKEITAEGASEEAQIENARRPKRTNAQLIAEQHIQALPVPATDFRFWTVPRNMQFVRKEMPIMDDIGERGETIAMLPTNGVVNVLEEVDTGWLYVESGRARGFIPKDSFLAESEKVGLMSAFNRLSARDNEEPGGQYLYAELTVPERQNKAFLWARCTAQETVIEKEYVTPAGDGTDILEKPEEGARVCGTMDKGTLGYLIKDTGEDWLYIESGDVRGFVMRKKLHTGSRARVEVRMAGGEEAFGSCRQLLTPQENEATYYTLTSIKEGSRTNPVRDCIIKSAEQCLGHPYLWGGTSLLNGCDCSGFVQGIYGTYGYTIPRVAENQALYGRQIPVDNALPGDLIFFAKDGYVYHVALYVGNDQTIEAFSAAYGIIRNRVDHANAVWATRVIQD